MDYFFKITGFVRARRNCRHVPRPRDMDGCWFIHYNFKPLIKISSGFAQGIVELAANKGLIFIRWEYCRGPSVWIIS